MKLTLRKLLRKPDLIIVYSTDKTLKISKIAPTIVVDYGKHKYLEQQEMLGKIMGKEDEVKNGKTNGRNKLKKMAKKSKMQLVKIQQFLS